MTQRDEDLELLNELLNKHADELTDWETEAFVSMRFDLTAGYEGPQFHQLTDKQRTVVVSAHERIVPQYANLVSRGLVPRGTPTAESKALDAMLSGPKVLRPPPRSKKDDK